MRTACHILFTLFTAAGLFCLLAAGGVSCAGDVSEGASAADSLALAEGLRLYEDGEFVPARSRFGESARSEDGYIRAESFLYLNATEMELGNYAAARPWLERYHAEVTRLSVERAEEQLARRHNRILAGIGIAVAALLAAGAAYSLRHRRENPPQAASVSMTPQSDSSGLVPFLVEAEAFRRTAIYAEIAGLAAQKPGRMARVMPLARQDVLDGELAVTFPGFMARLRSECPALTDCDVKLCCLSLAGLSSFGRAVCFGSTETNIIKQRKHQIKKKMDTGAGTLFEFIFQQCRPLRA